jgi:hypothetical protein
MMNPAPSVVGGRALRCHVPSTVASAGYRPRFEATFWTALCRRRRVRRRSVHHDKGEVVQRPKPCQQEISKKLHAGILVFRRLVWFIAFENWFSPPFRASFSPIPSFVFLRLLRSRGGRDPNRLVSGAKPGGSRPGQRPRSGVTTIEPQRRPCLWDFPARPPVIPSRTSRGCAARSPGHGLRLNIPGAAVLAERS